MLDRHRGVLGLITAVFGLALLLGTFVNPMFKIHDERFHADLVRLGRDPGVLGEPGWPSLGERSLSPGIALATRQQRLRRRTVDNAPPRDQRRPFDAWEERTVDGRRANLMAQHPPLYYLLIGSAVGVGDLLVPGAFAYDVELWVARVASLLLLLPLPLLGYLLARRLDDRPEVWVASAAAPLLIPGLTLRNGPMINNDTLVTALGALLVYLLVRLWQEDAADSRTAVAAGLIVGLAMLTKAFGLVLLGVLGLILLGLLVVHRSRRSRRRRVVASGALASVIAVGVGGWWYVRNLVESGSLQPKAVTRPETPDFEPDWLAWAGKALWRNWSALWGGDYVLGADRDALLLGVLIAVTIGLTGTALWRSRHTRRRALVVALVPLVALALSIYAESAVTYRAHAETGGLHGRYLHGGLLGLTTAMAVGAGHLFGGLRRWLPAAVVAGSGLLYGLGFNSLLVRNWSTPGSALVSRLRAVGAWAGPPDGFVLLVGVLFAASGLGLLARLVVDARIAGPAERGADDDPHPER